MRRKSSGETMKKTDKILKKVEVSLGKSLLELFYVVFSRQFYFSGVNSEPSQTSKVSLFATIVSDFKPLFFKISPYMF